MGPRYTLLIISKSIIINAEKDLLAIFLIMSTWSKHSKANHPLPFFSFLLTSFPSISFLPFFFPFLSVSHFSVLPLTLTKPHSCPHLSSPLLSFPSLPIPLSFSFPISLPLSLYPSLSHSLSHSLSVSL